MSVAAMVLSAGAAYSITPDGGFQRTAHADNPLDPLAMLEPDADWFRPRADVAGAAGPTAAAAPASDSELPGAAEPIAFAEPKTPKPVVRSAPVHRNPKPAWGASFASVGAKPPPPMSKLSFEQNAPMPQAFSAPPPPPAQVQAASSSSLKKKK